MEQASEYAVEILITLVAIAPIIFVFLRLFSSLGRFGV